jgi:hypothetical protein
MSIFQINQTQYRRSSYESEADLERAIVQVRIVSTWTSSAKLALGAGLEWAPVE